MRPMLATAGDALPGGTGWAYEFKWDGVRALLDVSGGSARLTSRAENDVTTAYPELITAAQSLGDVLLDGEIVAFVGGVPSFEALQARMHVRNAAEARRLAGTTPVTYVVFDLLRDAGRDLTTRPWRERRSALERLISEHPGWSLSPAFDDGPATREVAAAQGLEGVVAKRTDARYRPGVRSRDWVKLRFVRTGDFVVVGWESPSGEGNVLSSLVLAVSTADGPVLAGKVGSGLDGRTAAALQRRLTPRASCPLPQVPAASPGRTTHWVEPEVVVEVRFTLWTSEGRLRHPVFHRIRDDKTAEEAVGDA